MNSGHYLALMLRSLYKSNTLDLQAINRIYSTAEILTHVSAAVFDKYASLLGLRPDLRLEAGRVFGQLLTAGINLEAAISNVRRRTGFVISIEKETKNG
jgi:hypothetical protein